MKDNFQIMLSKSNNSVYESIPLKIQLMNVNGKQDCKIDVITDSSDTSFTISNSYSEVISKTNTKEEFIQHKIVSSDFRLFDTGDFSFFVKFSNPSLENISIQTIILSFSDNPVLKSKEPIYFDIDKIKLSSCKIVSSTPDSLSVTGSRINLMSKDKIALSDKPLYRSIHIKNVGNNSTRIYIGYAVYSSDGIQLDNRNYPYSKDILNVLAAKEGEKEIHVDQYCNWRKDSFIAIDAKEDMSDIPSTSLLDARIADFIKLEDGTAKIVLDRPLVTPLKTGTKIRVHGVTGAYLYTRENVLLPGEEKVFTSQIAKDEHYLAYSPKAFSRGVSYVVPLILSYSVNSQEDNTIEVSEFTISF